MFTCCLATYYCRKHQFKKHYWLQLSFAPLCPWNVKLYTQLIFSIYWNVSLMSVCFPELFFGSLCGESPGQSAAVPFKLLSTHLFSVPEMWNQHDKQLSLLTQIMKLMMTLETIFIFNNSNCMTKNYYFSTLFTSAALSWYKKNH